MTGQVVVREGMYCGAVDGGVVTTLTFTPVPLKPYRHTVECAACGTSYETNGLPEEFTPFVEMQEDAV